MIAAGRTAALLAVVALSCTSNQREQTGIVVQIDSDLLVPAQLDAVRVTVRGPSSQIIHSVATPLSPNVTGYERLPLWLPLVPAPPSEVPVGIEVVGLRTGAEVVWQRATVNFVRKRVLLLPLTLRAICIGQPCGQAESCGTQGTCQSRQIDPMTLAEYQPRDAGVADAGDGSATLRDGAGDRAGDGGGSDTAAADVAAAPITCMNTVANDCAAGLTCDFAVDPPMPGTYLCRPIGVVPEGGRCASYTQCTAGFSCLGHAEGYACRKFCNTDADCPGPERICVSNGVPGASTCSTRCIPTTAAGCPAGWNCVALSAGTNGPLHTNCEPPVAMAKGLGEPCSIPRDCQLGLTCPSNDQGMGTVCRKQCVVTTGEGCEAVPGTSCTSYKRPTFVGGVEYGTCL